MKKTRDDAAKILLDKGWTFQEVESILIKKTPTRTRVKKPKTTSKKNS